MTKKAKNWLAVALFAVLFGGLLTAATFTDLQVSHILTAHILQDHAYYTNNVFGTLFECVGSAPVYFMIAFAFQILALYALRFIGNKAGRPAAFLFCLAASTVAYYVFFHDSAEYLLQHLNAEAMDGAGFMTALCVFMGLVMTVFGTLAVNNFSDTSLKKLIKFAWAVLAMALAANLLVAIVKNPVGRMRYRAMNSEGGMSIGGMDNFTPWYVANGQMDKGEMLRLFGTTDACKSFPSGHTCAAGMSYGLIMLIDALEIKDRKKKAALWILPAVFTGTVAVSRIMVGAHFFSDVLMGGTISFVFMILFREIFICKGANVRALFGKE